MSKDRDHISWPDLLGAIDQTWEPERQERAYKHLAGCQDCLHRWQEIQRMQVIFSAGEQPESPPGGDCLDEEKIAIYLDQRLTEAETQGLQQHVQACDFCFYRLAHFYKCHQRSKPEEGETRAIPSWLMERALSLNQSASGMPQPQVGLGLRRVLAWIREGLFSPFPGYALAGICLLFLLWQGLSREAGQLVSFPETTGLWVFAEVPVAYRNGAGKLAMVLDESQALYQEPNFGGMMVGEKRGWGLIFSWPKMKDTQEYNFTLLSGGKERNRILVSVTTQKEKYGYSYEKYGPLEADHLYEWVISGNYGDGLRFKAQASFTIVK